MDDFKKSEVGTLSDELQALIDYGHDCCARIDDQIHECCKRIKRAHARDISEAFKLGASWKDVATLPQYDVLGNERHKAICELRKFEPMMGGRPTEEASKLIRCITGKSDSHVACANDLEETRDRLIHLLGGDTVEVEDGMDAGRCGETSAGGGVPAADKRCSDCDDNLPSEGVERITQELRSYMEAYKPFETDGQMVVSRIGTIGYEGFLAKCDSIDTLYAELERENEELRQRTMYPAESERVNMLEREIKRLTAECKTQRNNFDQATSAREHWKSLYEQALEHIEDLERDVEMWRDRAEDMRMERDEALSGQPDFPREDTYVMLPKDADGKHIQPSDIPHLTKVKDGMRLAYYPSLELRQDGTWRLAGWTLDRYRIIKPTVEDVLRELVAAYMDTPLDDSNDGEFFAEYAAKLRLADDAE